MLTAWTTWTTFKAALKAARSNPTVAWIIENLIKDIIKAFKWTIKNFNNKDIPGTLGNWLNDTVNLYAKTNVNGVKVNTDIGYIIDTAKKLLKNVNISWLLDTLKMNPPNMIKQNV